MRRRTFFERFVQQTNGFIFSLALIIARLVVGLLFFSAGVAKFNGWSAADYLENANGLFSNFFLSLAGSVWVDWLNIWGLTLIGLALIFGILVRPASIAAIALMLLYYVSDFYNNTAYGMIDLHIVLILLLVLF
ncbi:DoxX family protein, partial [Candidatus Parcubacteria bacterium]